MKYFFIIIAFVISGNLFSQKDSLNNRRIYGYSIGLINFIDYGIIKENIKNKTAYYQGFDINLFIRSKKNNFQFDFGVMGGDKYPIIKNLNYYLGGSYLLHPKNKKYTLDINPKIMYSYSKEYYDISRSIIRKELSLLVGVNAYRNFKKIEIGVGYYLWASEYKIIIRQSKIFEATDVIEKYHKIGFIPVGVIKLTAKFIFRKKRFI